MDPDMDYGTCCICESDRNVRNIIPLSYKMKVKSESGWGCLVCGLPNEGAMIVVCDDCIDDCLVEGDVVEVEGKVKFVMDGKTGRLPIAEALGEPHTSHEHDMKLHELHDAIHDMTGGFAPFW